MPDSPRKSYTDIDGRILTCYYFTSGETVYGNDRFEKHRLGGPAYANSVYECWYKNDDLHRTNGPAVTNRNDCNEDFNEYWVNGQELDYIKFQLQFYKLSQKEIIQLLYRKNAASWNNLNAIKLALLHRGLTPLKISQIIERTNIINALTKTL